MSYIHIFNLLRGIGKMSDLQRLVAYNSNYFKLLVSFWNTLKQFTYYIISYTMSDDSCK